MAKAQIKEWVTVLRNKNMPALGAVIAELNRVTGCTESDASQLAEVILRDPNLTSHVLRVANSVHYNYSSQQINTISRAIVLIGLKGIRAICISLLILDRLLDGQPKERVLELIAKGFHTATQAQALLESDDKDASEELFIAGLLFNLGEMSFLMSEDISENPDLLSDHPIERKKAMDAVLGGSFKELTAELAKNWNLSEVLIEALDPPKNPSRAASAVIVSERMSRAASFGWESPQFKKVLSEVADYSDTTMDAALQTVKSCADKASLIAVQYGAEEVCPMIPSSVEKGYFTRKAEHSKILKPDAQVQLSILRELNNASNENVDVNTIFQMVLEGMHRGVGLERVTIGFIQGHKVQAKYVLGEGVEHWRDSFVFDIGPYTDNIFTYAIENAGTAWLTKEVINANPDLYPDDLVHVVGRQPSLIYVLHIGTRNAAIFYADRASYGGQIDQEQFDSFKHFADQAQFNLNLLSKTKAS